MVSGVTINDVPLAEWLNGGHARDEKTREIEAERRERERMPEARQHRRKLKVEEKQDCRPSKCRKLTDDEIRREKGIMAKPHQTQIENILWIIANKGPITTRGIAKELGVERYQVLSGTLARLHHALGHTGANLLFREGKSGSKEKAYLLTVSAEQAISAYRNGPKPRNAKDIQDLFLSGPDEIKIEIPKDKAPVSKLSELLAETLSNVIGVKVSGNIEVNITLTIRKE